MKFIDRIRVLMMIVGIVGFNEILNREYSIHIGEYLFNVFVVFGILDFFGIVEWIIDRFRI